MKENRKWSGFAITGFVLGILLFVFGGILGLIFDFSFMEVFFMILIPIIFNIIGFKVTLDGKKRGKALAIAGLIISLTFVLLVTLGMVFSYFT